MARDKGTVKRLLSQSNVSVGNVNSQSGDGSTPLHEAAKRGFVDILDVLLQHKPDLTVRDSKGSTALQVRREEGRVAQTSERWEMGGREGGRK